MPYFHKYDSLRPLHGRQFYPRGELRNNTDPKQKFCGFVNMSLSCFPLLILFAPEENIKSRKMEQGGSRRKGKESVAHPLLVLEKDGLHREWLHTRQ